MAASLVTPMLFLSLYNAIIDFYILPFVVATSTSSSSSSSSLYRAVVDNSCHIITACLSWKIFTAYTALRSAKSTSRTHSLSVDMNADRKRQVSLFSPTSPSPCSDSSSMWRFYSQHKPFLDSLTACLIGSIIDSDHFIAGLFSRGSLSLFAATHLTTRPFGHAALFVLIIFLVLNQLMNSTLSLFPLPWIWIVSSTSHLLRDAQRRGVWLWPMGHTTPLPYVPNLLLICAFPIVLANIQLFQQRINIASLLRNQFSANRPHGARGDHLWATQQQLLVPVSVPIPAMRV